MKKEEPEILSEEYVKKKLRSYKTLAYFYTTMECSKKKTKKPLSEPLIILIKMMNFDDPIASRSS
ncbi:MAG: hypothetical protein GY749_27105 [Desulfobacteraceae bacterium]|nr:hypothetical protein [Desulfobacteraceae bacterium]